MLLQYTETLLLQLPFCQCVVSEKFSGKKECPFESLPGGVVMYVSYIKVLFWGRR